MAKRFSRGFRNRYLATRGGWGPVHQDQVQQRLWGQGISSDGVTIPDTIPYNYKGTDRTPRQGSSYDFDGINGVVTIPHDASLTFGNGTSDSPFSITAWVNMDDATTFRILTKTGASNTEWNLSLSGSDRLFFILCDDVVANRIGRQTNVLTTYENQDLFVVATYDGGGLNTGINVYVYNSSGTLLESDASNNTSGSYTAMDGNSLSEFIGYDNEQGSYANGQIWDCRVHNVELTSDQITTVFRGGASGNEVGWWALEEEAGTTAFDKTTNANHGTTSGGVTFARQDVYSFANEEGYNAFIDFNGTDSEFDLTSEINLAADFTVSLWVRIDTAGKIVLSNSIPASYIYFNTAASLRINVATVNYDFLYSRNLGEWDHLLIWRSGTDMTIYQNGVQSATTNTVAETFSFDKLGTWIAGFYYDGGVRDLRVYEEALSEADIARVYAGQVLGTESNHWKFNGDLTDSAGGNDGVSAVNISYGVIPKLSGANTDPLGAALDYTGKAPINGSLVDSHCGTFNGSSDSITHSDITFSGAFKISGWMYFPNTATQEAIIGYGSGVSPNKLSVGVTNGKFFLRVIDGGSSDQTVNTPATDTWTFIEIERDSNDKVDLTVGGTTTRLFSDSAQSGDSTWQVIGSAGSVFGACRLANMTYEDNGTIVAHYPLAEGEGLVAFDVSGNGNHGTISATASAFWASVQDNYHYNITEGFDDFDLFDGSTSEVDFGSQLANTLSVASSWSITLEFITGTDVTTTQYLIASTDTGADLWAVTISSGELDILVYNGAFTERYDITVTANTYYKLSLMWGGSSWTVKTLNGIGIDSPSVNSFSGGSSDSTVLGRRADLGANFFGGYIKSLEIDGVGKWRAVNGWNDEIGSVNPTTITGLSLTKVPLINGTYQTLTNPAGAYWNNCETEWLPNPLGVPAPIRHAGVDETTQYTSFVTYENEFIQNEDITKVKNYLLYPTWITDAQNEAINDSLNQFSPDDIVPFSDIALWFEAGDGYGDNASNIQDGGGSTSVEGLTNKAESVNLDTTTVADGGMDVFTDNGDGSYFVEKTTTATQQGIILSDLNLSGGETYKVNFTISNVTGSISNLVVGQDSNTTGSLRQSATIQEGENIEYQTIIADNFEIYIRDSASNNDVYSYTISDITVTRISQYSAYIANNNPSYNEASVISDRAITFDGVDEYLSIDPTPFLSDTAGEFCIVVKQDTTGRRILNIANSGTTTNVLSLSFGAGGEIRLGHGTTTNYRYDSTITNFTDIKYHILFMGSDGSNYFIRADGLTHTIDTGTDNGDWIADLAAAPNTMAIGSLQFASPAYYAIGIKALAYCQGRLFTDAERGRIETYFNSKYRVFNKAGSTQ